MSEQEKQESQKTVVSFIAGLLIGGLLVWVFGGTPETTPDIEDSDTPVSETTDSEAEEASEEDNTPEETGTETTSSETQSEATPIAELPIGNGDATVTNQPAGTTVTLESATFPSDEGWIGVRDYVDDQLGGLLGVVRYSKEQGLVPETIIIQRATVPGNTYAVVFYSDNGDRDFNLADDTQIGGPVETFTAQ